DPAELSAGFRLLPGLAELDGGVAEVYLYDTASGGAGYAADAGEELDAVLQRTADVLDHCPAGCERSCTKCLRHYGNRFLHGRLDRRLAADLLRYARHDELPAIQGAEQQASTLGPLRRFLELEGWTVASEPAASRPLIATSTDGRSVVVGTYPALLSGGEAEANHPVSARSSESRVLLPNYVVERDLPAAYQIVAGLQSAPRRRRARSSVAPPDRADGQTVSLAARELQRPDADHGTVRLVVPGECPPDAIAVRVPTDKLARLGFDGGAWVVLTSA